MYLDVPFVSQLDFGGDLHLDDPTGCWYASACMIAYSFEAGPRQGVPQLYSMQFKAKDNKVHVGHWSLSYGWLPTLMKNEHLAEVAKELPASPAVVEIWLRYWGPIMLSWMKTANGQTYGHASVIIGIRGDRLIYHDPENAPRSEMPLKDMRAKYATGWPLLRREGLPFGYQVAQKA